ncbi:tetratricopeptide repeat protein [Spirillospora sp. NPDC048911]|uniref:tetratricopeptide repeat protein n=1 Tax=Spirillospora sp. NPDC048911 TaxID=3364527 RepID=UPI003724B993
MRKVFEERALTAGWTRGADGDVFREPDGAEAFAVAGGDGLPDRELLCVTWEPAGRRISFAVGFENTSRHTGGDWFERIADLALAGPAMVAAGAVVPWLDRVRHETPVWVREATGPWWPLGGGVGRRKADGPGEDLQPLVTTLLGSLTAEPRPETQRRAARTLDSLRDAGWRDTTARAATKPEPGLRVLWMAALSGPAKVRHHIAYVLTGDPELPEALWWRCAFPETAGTVAETWNLMIDVTGATGPELPFDDHDDQLEEMLALIRRSAPDLLAGEPFDRLCQGLVAAAAVHYWRGQRWTLARMRFGEDVKVAPSRDTGLTLEEAAAEVRAHPDDGDRWLAAGFAAVKAQLPHLAVTTFGKAAELGVAGGLPLMCRGWLRRYLNPHAALDDLERAAAGGGVTGESHRLRGLVLNWVIGDVEQSIAAFTRGTTEDPAHVTCWAWRGLILAKSGRAAEAVEVLTEATELHADGELWYFLGYAQMLTGEHGPALDSLEQAVRLSPWLANEIVEDLDLHPLRTDPRFARLPELAAAAETTYHRNARAAVRPPGPPPTAQGDLADLTTIFEMRGVHPRRLDDHKLPGEIAEPRLRSLLREVGLPRAADGFELDLEAYSETLRPYELGGHRGLPGDRLPPGLGDGLYILGRLDDGGEAAVDGATGEIYRVSPDHTLTYLAPTLGAFLLPRVLPPGEHVWHIRPGRLDRLDDVTGIEEGKVALLAEELPEVELARLMEFLSEHGRLLDKLTIRSYRFTTVDLSALDLAASCPNLRYLAVRDGLVNASVFTHPALEELYLRESEYKGEVRDIRLDTGSRLRVLSFEDCVVHADSLYAGPGSPLSKFHTGIDEDYSGAFPERLEFDNCPDLYDIHVNADAAVWHLTLRGSLPKLSNVQQDANPYGSFTSSVEGATPGDRKHYLSLIKRGKDYTKRW